MERCEDQESSRSSLKRRRYLAGSKKVGSVKTQECH